MRQSTAISNYLDTLTHELRFDIPLAHRVRQEVGDHLWEAAAAELGDATAEAQHRAIRNFGDPRDVASQFAALSLFKQTRRTGMTVILVAAVLLVVMRARIVWNGMMHWSLSANLRGVGRIDRGVFMFALVIGIVCCAYVLSRRISATFDASYRDQLKRCLQLCVLATGALIASAVTDAILIALRLFDGAPRMTALILLSSVTAEIAFAGILILQIRKTIQRAAHASSLLCS